jgi:hypothetical protein
LATIKRAYLSLLEHKYPQTKLRSEESLKSELS